MAGWVLRTFETREVEPMKLLFKSLVIPILEYSCQLWSPKKLYLIRRLESVQRAFTAKITGMNNIDYWERLKQLQMFSLERRRDRYCAIMCGRF